MTNVVPFPRDAGLRFTPEQTMRRVRLQARFRGLTGDHRERLLAAAQHQLDAGRTGTPVINDARTFARRLAQEATA